MQYNASVTHLRCWILLAAFVAIGSACAKSPSKSAVPELSRPATIKDIMDSMVDPAGDFMFEAIREIADEQGVRQIAPHTDEDWANVRRNVFTLIEAPNLLTMEGRKVAQPNEKAKNPGVELQPEEIQKLIDADRPAFIRRAKRLQDAASSALKAVDAKDKDLLFKSIDSIDKACENCHLHYWYPDDQRAQEAAKQDGLAID
jgi:cytochrome c556